MVGQREESGDGRGGGGRDGCGISADLAMTVVWQGEGGERENRQGKQGWSGRVPWECWGGGRDERNGRSVEEMDGSCSPERKVVEEVDLQLGFVEGSRRCAQGGR